MYILTLAIGSDYKKNLEKALASKYFMRNRIIIPTFKEMKPSGIAQDPFPGRKFPSAPSFKFHTR
jgi:hypothetical protein